jgi:RNA polymerase sigma-54 factor
LSTLDLNQEIEKFLQDNPLLERTDDFDEGSSVMHGETETVSTERHDADSAPEREHDHVAESAHDDERGNDVVSTDDWGEETSYGNPRSEDDDNNDQQFMVAAVPSLREHLEAQLRLTALDQRDLALVTLLIDTLDEDGFLTQPLEEIADSLPEELDVELEELQVALRLLQTFEPAGIAARNLSECLLLQLDAMETAADSRACLLARRLVAGHLDLLASKDYNKLKRQLQCTDVELRAAQDLIQRLNPRPGAQFGAADTRYVIADVVVRQVKGVWIASLNSAAMPRLRVNRMYADILSRHRDGSGGQMASQLQEAKWLIKNVQQRFNTILRVAQEIVDRQSRFFEHGEVAMRPLVLRDVADAVGLHESTISRVTTQKYMLTPRGIYELKYFFGSHVETDTGGECSAIAIRALIKQLIANEDQKKPLSDSTISELLAKQGIVVARRTVAKYREAMQIPPVNQRKSL